MGRASFNLIERPWIPVEEGAGGIKEVNLSELFADAKKLRRIVHASPVVTAALYRLAFAIMHRALRAEDVEEWQIAWADRDFAVAVAGYLDKFRDRFDLFSSEAPFWQVLEMPENCRPYPWTKLALELPPNSSKLLFDHTVTTDPPLAEPAEVARVLIASQCFAVGAGRSCTGYTTHAPLASALVVIPEGRDLAETLLANLTLGSGSEDEPIWEIAPLTAGSVMNESEQVWKGPAARLTWPARSLRLLPDDDAGRVKWISFGMGWRHVPIAGDRDPWVSYRTTKDGSRVARKLDPDRMAWRDFHAMLAGSDDGEAEPVQVLSRLALLADTDRPPPPTWSVLAAGLMADKANVKAWRQERWSLPESVVSDGARVNALRTAMSLAEEFGSKVDTATWFVAAELLGGKETAAKGDIQEAARALPSQVTYWSALEATFQRLLELLGEDVDVARLYWLRSMAAAVRTAANATHAALGLDARGLKAWAKGGQGFERLRARLDRLVVELEGNDQEVVRT